MKWKEELVADTWTQICICWQLICIYIYDTVAKYSKIMNKIRSFGEFHFPKGVWTKKLKLKRAKLLFFYLVFCIFVYVMESIMICFGHENENGPQLSFASPPHWTVRFPLISYLSYFI